MVTNDEISKIIYEHIKDELERKPLTREEIHNPMRNERKEALYNAILCYDETGNVCGYNIQVRLAEKEVYKQSFYLPIIDASWNGVKKSNNLPDKKVKIGYDGKYQSQNELLRKNNIEQGCIIVSTMQNFNITKPEDRKIYDHNENFETHFKKITDTSNYKLERFEDGNYKGQVKYSFVNLINLFNPLVIVDEAHHNTTDLSFETLNRINPACIIEFTATPSEQSNILHRVTAMELKNEEMIKLPIMLTEYPSWQESIEAFTFLLKGNVLISY